ncbi:hypothetical protein SpCBS45565_g07434 [Spizellomyces sp. 'palustris']|nr:hypothetical protein SpCBS45565_g07434 [Spizellomyces sp. 'palustris']
MAASHGSPDIQDSEASQEDWERTIEDLTAELQRTSLSAQVLLKRAAAFKAVSKYDEALRDIKTALSLDRNNAEAIAAMRDLLRTTSEEAAPNKVSLKSFLLQATGSISNDDKDRPKKARQAFEAAQRLMVVSKEPDVCRRLVKEGGVELLFPAMIRERKTNGEQGAPSLQAALLSIIGNIASIPEHAPLLLPYITEETISLILGEQDAMSVQLATDIVSTLVLQASGQLLQLGLTDNANLIIKTLTRRLDPSHSDVVRVASFGSLIKAIANGDLAMALVRSSENVALFGLVDDSNEKIRGLVPAALARIFEQVDDKNEKAVQEACYRLIRDWLDGENSSKKSKGLLALAAVFHARSSYGSAILMKPGLLESIMDCIEFEPVEIQLATIEVLSSACAEKECRTLVANTCSPFLQKMIKEQDGRLRSAASVTVTKLVSANKELGKLVDLNPLNMAESFVVTLNDSKADTTSKLRAVEGLAYLTMQPAIKEKMAYNLSFMKTLLGFVASEDRALHFGVVTIVANLTSYRRKLTQEEEQVRKLREMAKDISVEKPDPLDDELPVAKRALMAAQAGAISAVVHLAKSDSPRIRDTISQIFLNFATDKRLHGVIVQQGGAKALVELTKSGTPEGIAIAAQALAKVAITVDPNLAFKGQRAAEIVRPLIALCNGENGLRQFEALMALTNLASMNDEVRTRIVQAGGVKAMEYLQFSDNEMISRAATEALCNMMFDPQVYNSYANAGQSHRLRMFVALSDAEDFGTRRAAAGALAILSSSENACRLIMEESRGIEVVMGMVKEEEPHAELHHRGVECVKNLARANADYARRLEAAGAVNALKRLLLANDEAVAHGAAEALSSFQDQGISIM